MRHLNGLYVVFGFLLATACGVDSSDDPKGAGSSQPGISVHISTDKSPAYMETATLSCTYEVVAPILPVGRDDYVAEGHFVFYPTHFALVSGDSSWVDTLKVDEKRTHQVVVRALVRGDWLVDAEVKSVIEKDLVVISGAESVELHVK